MKREFCTTPEPGTAGRILMTTDPSAEIWTFTLELSRALCARGWEVWLAMFGAAPSMLQQNEAEQISGLRLFPSSYKLEWMDDPWRDIEAAGEWLLDLKNRCRPDVVHLNSFSHAALPWDTPVVLAAHWCVTSRWRAVRGEEPPANWHRYRRYVTEALRAPITVTAPSRAMADALERNYAVAPGTIRVVPPGRAVVESRHRLKTGLILTMGHPQDEARNVRKLARVAGELPWPVCIAGPDHDSAGQRLSLDNCMMLGEAPAAELADWYARASIFAMPARYAPSDYSILDAALAGCVLVLGDIPSLREAWRGAAVFVPSDDEAILSYTLRELAGQPRWRELMGLRARTRAQMFTADRMADQYLALYNGVREERAVFAS